MRLESMAAAGQSKSDRYLADGYYISKSIVPVDRVIELLSEIDLLLIGILQTIGLPIVEKKDRIESIHGNLITLHRHDQDLYIRTLRIFGYLQSLYHLFSTPAILETCKEFGVRLPFSHTQPIFHLLSNSLKIARGYFGFSAHQDWSGLQTSLNSVVVWAPFHSIDCACFPLEIIPSSHRQGLCAGKQTGNDYELAQDYVTHCRFDSVDVSEGDVVFMSPFLVHRTGLSETKQIRIAASWRFEDGLEKTFIERGLPLAQSRRVSHQLVTPGFPSPDALDAALESIRLRTH